MSRTHFKRYRMEVSLDRPFPEPALPEGFRFVPWHDHLLDLHAEIKYRCFVDDLDSLVFPNLGSLVGCRFLMRSIRAHPGFCPRATWLIEGPDGFVGTVQGVIEPGHVGALQNLGVLPRYRGIRLGTALLLQAIQGFQDAAVGQMYLEVTAENVPAVRLYRQYGFRCTRVIYRPVSAETAVAAGGGI